MERALACGNLHNLLFLGEEWELVQQAKSTPQEAARAWVESILKLTGWTPHRLAKEAGVSPSTLSRILNDPRFVTKPETLSKIATAAKVASPVKFGATVSSTATQLDEPEADFIEETAEIPTSFVPGEGEGVWLLKSRAVELAGYLPGDVLLVSQHILPSAGDVVCVQLYDLGTDSAETAFRVYDPPYVTLRTMDATLNQKPRLVDDEHVSIWGTVIRSLRVRHES